MRRLKNESRSENIKWGVKQCATSGTSKLYDRKCYGYKHDKGGGLIVDEEKVPNVKLIFALYLNGQSIIGIIKELELEKENALKTTFPYSSIITSDIINMNIDNDHTEDPSEYITEAKMDELFPGINYCLVPSRHHMLEKELIQ